MNEWKHSQVVEKTRTSGRTVVSWTSSPTKCPELKNECEVVCFQKQNKTRQNKTKINTEAVRHKHFDNFVMEDFFKSSIHKARLKIQFVVHEYKRRMMRKRENKGEGEKKRDEVMMWNMIHRVVLVQELWMQFEWCWTRERLVRVVLQRCCELLTRYCKQAFDLH